MSRARVVMMLCVCGLLLRATGDEAAMKLAGEVVQAGGGNNWGKVSRLQFTFNVIDENGKTVLSAKHDWNVRKGTDTVTWNGKTVTVDLSGKHDEGDAHAAYARWTNDSYWLLAPIKLLDGGVKLQSKGEQTVEGKKYDVLHVSFEHVGMTPGDQYNLYIDPDSHLVQRWDYMPAPDKKTSGTWEDYQQFGPLKLATKHQFGSKQINFTDVSAETD
jgi:hypothetical protein